MEPSFVEVFRLLNFPNSDVRKAALEAAFTFCTTYAKIVAARDNQHGLYDLFHVGIYNFHLLYIGLFFNEVGFIIPSYRHNGNMLNVLWFFCPPQMV